MNAFLRTGKNRACVDAHAHVHFRFGFLTHGLDSLHHGESHVAAQDGMIGARFRCATYAIVCKEKEIVRQEDVLCVRVRSKELPVAESCSFS